MKITLSLSLERDHAIHIISFSFLLALVYSVAGSVTQCRQVADIDCDNNYTPSGDERVCSSDLKDCPTL